MTEISRAGRSALPPSIPPPAAPAAPPRPPAAAPLTRGPASAQVARLLGATAAGGKNLADAADAYFIAAKHRYTVDGKPVEALPQFRMVGGMNQDKARVGLEALKGLAGRPGQPSLDVIGHVLAGRGSPADVARVTQSLIDAGKLPPARPGQTPEGRVQQMMWEHGVGIDCAGYVQRALMTVHGKSAAQLGLRKPLDEDLGSLAQNPHFKRVGLADVNPGDVITLRDNDPRQPGHTVLVARHFTADGASMSWRFPLHDAGSAGFIRSKNLEVFEVDASWGAGMSGTNGGVKRAMWVFNHEDGKWASFGNPIVDQAVLDTPYPGHTLVGAFRPR